MHWLRICLCVFELVRSFTMFYAFFAFEWCALCGFLLARLTKRQLFRYKIELNVIAVSFGKFSSIEIRV